METPTCSKSKGHLRTSIVKVNLLLLLMSIIFLTAKHNSYGSSIDGGPCDHALANVVVFEFIEVTAPAGFEVTKAGDDFRSVFKLFKPGRPKYVLKIQGGKRGLITGYFQTPLPDLRIKATSKHLRACLFEKIDAEPTPPNDSFEHFRPIESPKYKPRCQELNAPLRCEDGSWVSFEPRVSIRKVRRVFAHLLEGFITPLEAKEQLIEEDVADFVPFIQLLVSASNSAIQGTIKEYSVDASLEGVPFHITARLLLGRPPGHFGKFGCMDARTYDTYRMKGRTRFEKLCRIQETPVDSFLHVQWCDYAKDIYMAQEDK